jgi:hypothetical protein
MIRNLKGAEANVLADKAKARKFSTFDEVLENCWLETEDGGALGKLYINGTGHPNWRHVLLGDRTYVLIQIRIATYGKVYSFPVKCSSCGEGFEWDIDLETDLKYQTYPAESLRKYAEGENRFAGKLPDGKKFWFKLTNGMDERESAKRLKQKKDEAVTVSLSERITEIEGIGTSKQQIRAYLEDLDMGDGSGGVDALYDIVDMLDEADGGYDTDIEVECSECGGEQTVRLPFGADFWTSRRRRRKKAEAED